MNCDINPLICLIFILGGVLLCSLFFGNVLYKSCNIFNNTEGYLTNPPYDYTFRLGVPNNYWPNSPPSANVMCKNMYEKLANNNAGSVPPKGLLIFENNVFKPECCLIPKHYSSSSGCACFSKEQMQYINSRGGNNTLA